MDLSYFPTGSVRSINLSQLPLFAMRCHHDCPQAGVIESDVCGGRAVQQVQCHARPPGCGALHDNERAARDFWEPGQRLGGGDGSGDGNGVDDVGGQFQAYMIKGLSFSFSTSIVHYIKQPLSF
jgi:hypothetical protein